MLNRLSYAAFGFVLGIGCFLAVVSFNNDSDNLQKTGRLESAVAPANFVMERFAG